ncbi:MAG: polymer-forming cytoskeletal protein [Pseudomonadota bacterium]|nr:polymer-forming cytoskeletal protein [Pseudomonadota bacterium]
MFKTRTTGRNGDPIDTLIGRQVVIRGDLHFSGGLVIEGRVIGKVVADEGESAVLTVSEHGWVQGEVRAPVVIINGRLEGDVYASERVELAAQARVEGNVNYKVVEMAAGSTLTGRLVHVDPLRDHAADATGEPRPSLPTDDRSRVTAVAVG